MHIVKKVIQTAIFLILALVCVNSAQAQRRKVIYLQTYDWAPYHFGFLVGANFMDYNLIVNQNYQNVEYTDFNDLSIVHGITSNGFKSYQVTSISRDTTGFFSSVPQPGFSVGVIGDLRLGEYLNLRFSPTFSLSSIKINYTLQINYDDRVERHIEQSDNPHVNCLEFPLHVKYRSKRYNNIGAYLIAGVNPKLYFTFSNAPVEWIRTSPFDLAFEMGTEPPSSTWWTWMTCLPSRHRPARKSRRQAHKEVAG